MKVFNRAIEWGHGKFSPDPRRWPSRLPLLRWNGRRAFTSGHSLEHVLAMGATGSGKTSAGIRSVALGMLHAGYGVLFLTAKTEDAADYLKLAKQAGREKSVVNFGPKHRLGFNLLEYELTRGGELEERTMNMAASLPPPVKLWREVAPATVPGRSGSRRRNNCCGTRSMWWCWRREKWNWMTWWKSC